MADRSVRKQNAEEPTADAYEVSADQRKTPESVVDSLDGKKEDTCIKLINEDLQTLKSIFSKLGAPQTKTNGENDKVVGNTDAVQQTDDQTTSVLSTTKSLPSVANIAAKLPDDISFSVASPTVKPQIATQTSRSMESSLTVQKTSAEKAASGTVVKFERPKTVPTIMDPALVKRPPSPPVAKDFVKTASSFNYERYRRYKLLAEKAAKERKVFTILGGYPTVRNALLKRGWLERLWDNQYVQMQQKSHHSLLEHAQPGNEYEVVLISKLLQSFPSNFIWYPRYMNVTRFDGVQPFKSRMDRPREFDFTLKEGMVNIWRSDQWLHIPGKSELICPRSYRLFLPDELNEFMADYRFTGCTSLLAFIVDGQRPNGKNIHFSETGKLYVD